MVRAVFPFIEEERDALQARQAKGAQYNDAAARNFLHALEVLRPVVVVDLALLYDEMPDHLIYQYPPFNSADFLSFAQGAPDRLAAAKLANEENLNLVSDKLAVSIRNYFEKREIREREQEHRMHTMFNNTILQLMETISRLQATPVGSDSSGCE